jgi:hypothetical protein
VKARSQGRSTSGETAFPSDEIRKSPASPLSTLSNVASESFPKLPKRSGRRRWLLGGFLVAVALLAAFAVTFAFLHSNHASEAGGQRIVSKSDGAAGTKGGAVPPVGIVPQALRDVQVGATMPRPDAATTHANGGAPAPALPVDAGLQVSIAAAAPIDARHADPPATAPHREEHVVATSPVDAGVVVTSPNASVATPRSSTPRPPVEKGTLSIYVAPFAQVWVDDATESVGQTPQHLKLRVGPHRIRLANKRLNKDVTVSVTVTTAKEALIDETW